MINPRRRLAVRTLVIIALMALIATVDAVIEGRTPTWLFAAGLWIAAALIAFGLAWMRRT